MICLCNIYPYQNTLLEYKTNKRVGFQNNFKMRHDDMMNHLDYILFIKYIKKKWLFFYFYFFILVVVIVYYHYLFN